MARELNIREFKIDDLPQSCSFIIIGRPGTGKSSFIKNVAYYNRHKYPTAKVITGDIDGYKEYKRIFTPLFTTFNYTQPDEDGWIQRQTKCVDENDKGYIGNGCIHVLDDLSGDPKIYKSKEFQTMYKVGSRHWDSIIMTGLQYAIDMPLPVRRSSSYYVLFEEESPVELEKLYKHFGGVCGDKKDFYKILKEVTGNYTCLIIDNLSKSPKLEDKIFWYQTKKLPDDWKFGSEEFRGWSRERYDKEYQEVMG